MALAFDDLPEAAADAEVSVTQTLDTERLVARLLDGDVALQYQVRRDLLGAIS